MIVTEPSFTALRLLHFFVAKDSYTEIYKNPTNPLATENISQRSRGIGE
jgi:hypothetical protein